MGAYTATQQSQCFDRAALCVCCYLAAEFEPLDVDEGLTIESVERALRSQIQGPILLTVRLARALLRICDRRAPEIGQRWAVESLRSQIRRAG